MKIPFYKFDGAGNDFVVIDNREGQYRLPEEEIRLICHRRFGVGADGLMTLEKVAGGEERKYAFEMKYYNSDGRLGSMCGNGGRCIAMFAHLLGMGHDFDFLGYDGPHDATVMEWDPSVLKGMVSLGMRDVKKCDIRRLENGWFLDTGSPHYVVEVKDLEHYDVVGEGRRLRHRADLFPEGAHIDFVEKDGDVLYVRTYERGVEDETLACGTGVTASALVTGMGLNIVTRGGGDFSVLYSETDDAYTHVCLVGPVSLNFTGEWTSSAR